MALALVPIRLPLISNKASCKGHKAVTLTVLFAVLVFSAQQRYQLFLYQSLTNVKTQSAPRYPRAEPYPHLTVPSSARSSLASSTSGSLLQASLLRNNDHTLSARTGWSTVTVASLICNLTTAVAVALFLNRRQPAISMAAATAGDAGSDATGTTSAPATKAQGQDDEAQVDEQEGSPKSKLEAELEQVKGRLAEVEKKYLYALAEIETVRRRGRQQTEDAQKFGIEKFALSLLEVADNMARGLAWVPKEVSEGPSGEENPNPDLRSLWGGMKSTEKIMLNVFEKHGIQKYDPLGEIYDPNLARAVAQVPNAANEPGTVLQVVSAGYTLNGRVLRPADVVVVQDSSS